MELLTYRKINEVSWPNSVGMVPVSWLRYNCLPKFMFDLVSQQRGRGVDLQISRRSELAELCRNSSAELITIQATAHIVVIHCLLEE